MPGYRVAIAGPPAAPAAQQEQARFFTDRTAVLRGMRSADGRQHLPQEHCYRHRQAKGDCPERQVLAKTIEDQLLTLLSELDLELLDERVREYRLELLHNQPQVAHICGAIDLAEKRLERLPVLYLDGAITHTHYLQQQQNTEAQIEALKAQLPELTNANTFHATADRLLLILERLAGGQPYLAHQLLGRVEVAAGHITHLEPQEWLAPLWPVVEKLLIY